MGGAMGNLSLLILVSLSWSLLVVNGSDQMKVAAIQTSKIYTSTFRSNPLKRDPGHPINLGPSTTVLRLPAPFKTTKNGGAGAIPTKVISEVNTATLKPTKSPDKHNYDTDLHQAAIRGDEAAVIKLVQAGANVNARDYQKRTPLHMAALTAWDTCKKIKNSSCLNTIKYLIEHRTDVYAKDNSSLAMSVNATFLHIILEWPALSPGQFHDLAEFLISKNYSSLFNTAEEGGATPFLLAVRGLEVEQRTLILLHKNGVDFNAQDSLKRSSLAYALMGHRTVAFHSNLIDLGADCHHRANRNETYLHVVTVVSNPEAMKFYIGKGLDVNAVDRDGLTPLHWLTVANSGMGDNYECARLLLENGASLKMKDKDGLTPVDWLKSKGILDDKEKVLRLFEEWSGCAGSGSSNPPTKHVLAGLVICWLCLFVML